MNFILRFKKPLILGISVILFLGILAPFGSVAHAAPLSTVPSSEKNTYVLPPLPLDGSDSIDTSAYTPSASDITQAQEIKRSLDDGTYGRYQPAGKFGLTAKAGVYAIRAAMKRIGRTAWDKAIHRIESMTGTQIVWFHWASINKLLDAVTGFEGNIEDGITRYLVRHGWNSWIAGRVSWLFITIFL